jgi:mRNA-degrading endonuclease HigB of HigAB toxin-antitoxin module
MGVSESFPLRRHFAEISEQKWSHAESVITAYNAGNYDFGIDYNVVMNITGYDSERAKTLVNAHMINDLGV